MISVVTIVTRLMDFYGLDQRRFAEQFNVNPSQVSRWLKGDQIPRTEVYLKLKEEYDKLPTQDTLPLLQKLS